MKPQDRAEQRALAKAAGLDNPAAPQKSLSEELRPLLESIASDLDRIANRLGMEASHIQRIKEELHNIEL